MIKRDELQNLDSCLNHAADDEPIFVLRAKDPLAPTIVGQWAVLAAVEEIHENKKINEALAFVKQMQEWRKINIVEK